MRKKAKPGHYKKVADILKGVYVPASNAEDKAQKVTYLAPTSFVAFASAKAISNVTPRSDTILVSIEYGTSDSVITKPQQENKNTWKKHVIIDMNVYGCRGSFQETDDQARRIGEQIHQLIQGQDYAQLKLIFQCQHGEMRSKALAKALAYCLGIDLHTVENNGAITPYTEQSASDTFASRTMSIVADALE